VRRQAVRRHELRALLQRAGEVYPAPSIELLDGLTGSCEPLHLTTFESLEQPLTERIVWRRDVLDAIFEDLDVSQLTERPEQLA
jgi:hypothetical protein